MADVETIPDVPRTRVGEVVQGFVNQRRDPKKRIVCVKQENGKWTVAAHGKK